MTDSNPAARLSERGIILVIAAVQFINILDFVMVMPLGPYFAGDLGIDPSRLGYVAGAYTAAASVAGILASAFLDRFDRRTALGFSLFGLVAGTAAGGLVHGLPELMAARLLAGFFGGPATSVALAIVADVVPDERRGRAMGTVMTALSVAQVFGVPASLLVAQQFGWRASFFAVATLGLALVIGAVVLLPSLRQHLEQRRAGPLPGYRELFARRIVLVSYAMTATTMLGGFLMVPNMPAYVTGNLGFPADRLHWLYAVSGLITVVTIPLVGRLIDRFGSFRVGTLGVAMNLVVSYFVFYVPDRPIPGIGRSVLAIVGSNYWMVTLFFVGFMLALSFRNVAYNTLTTRVPDPAMRVRFNGLQSSVGHLASASGAFLSSFLMQAAARGRAVALPPATAAAGPQGSPIPLIGMERVALLSMALACALPFFLRIVESRVATRRPAVPPRREDARAPEMPRRAEVSPPH
jgi:predicted MFS family arabinose efflux permease